MKGDVQRRIGNAGNLLLFTSMLIVSAMLLYRLPTEAYFDTSWLNSGFCVANNGDIWTNSHVLSFYVDVCFSLANVAMYVMLRHKLSAYGQAMAFGSILSVFGHGVGHLHYGSKGGMDLRFFADKPMESLINTCVMLFTYAAIFCGTMPLASKKRIVATAIICCALHNILDIPPTLMFVYAQAAIYITGSLHQLSLEQHDKESAAYMAFGLLQMPVVAVGILEATQCEQFLKKLGGHAIYDGMIGVVTLANVGFAAYCDDGKADQQKKFR